MNEFTNHILILQIFLMGLAIAFIITFSLEVKRAWLAILVILLLVLTTITILARSDDNGNIGETN